MANLEAKCDYILKHVREYDQRIVHYMDVERVPKDMMALRFLWEVGDDQLLDWLHLWQYVDPIDQQPFVRKDNNKYELEQEQDVS
jgi:hypothetical protein